MTAPTTLTPRGHVREKTFPIIEIFGPTIQGEGAEAGLPTHFVRLGGCDYRCSWCDTMYAVDPETVRATAVSMSSDGIAERVDQLSGRPDWVAISGGNPALHQLDGLVELLHARGYRVSVETQGSLWRDWLHMVDRLTISPKPPSSGMSSPKHLDQFSRFMRRAIARKDVPAVLKIVCFDDVDLDWATERAAEYPDLPLFLSAGTPVPAVDGLRDAVGIRYRWLCERVAESPALSAARVLPQLHVIAWEGAKGV
ncbi:7-carboxy-7-deazaguanine synthase QueE [Solirubrobacter soli]|uniref:7-carboxy-7-deazaguanine synthase QueE n=1 Tax=Solirubrobacter soli TaxID=363832 RepID=UPI000409EEFC|nr:7-carboxy-7-deazaguanine synthase QueE [Solirubrobacter soli]